MAEGSAGKPILKVRALHVCCGESHAIQGVDLTLDRRIVSIVGRDGMGETTLCNTIVGLKRAKSGSIALAGAEPGRGGRPPPRRASCHAEQVKPS